MILTVTPHSALDKVIFIDEWTSGIPMRTDKIVTCVGGKGLDSSVVLSCLGVETVGLTFVAGETGKELMRVVQRYGILPEPVWVDGETRIAHVIVERMHDRHSHIITNQLRISPGQVDEFLQRFRQRMKEAAWVICAGSIPPVISQDLYRRITEIAAKAGVPVLIDSSRRAITEAIPARPAVFKMNQEEFEWTFELKIDSMDDLKRQAARIYRHFDLEALVLTLGADGILAYSKEAVFQASPPWQKPVNAAGSGDAVSSALAWRFSLGESWPEALKWAGAVSAAVTLTEATAECRMEDVLRILPEVRVMEITGSTSTHPA